MKKRSVILTSFGMAISIAHPDIQAIDKGEVYVSQPSNPLHQETLDFGDFKAKMDSLSSLDEHAQRQLSELYDPFEDYQTALRASNQQFDDDLEKAIAASLETAEQEEVFRSTSQQTPLASAEKEKEKEKETDQRIKNIRDFMERIKGEQIKINEKIGPLTAKKDETENALNEALKECQSSKDDLTIDSFEIVTKDDEDKEKVFQKLMEDQEAALKKRRAALENCRTLSILYKEAKKDLEALEAEESKLNIEYNELSKDLDLLTKSGSTVP